MTFTFDYQETLERKIKIDADSLHEAMDELYRRLENEEIVLGSEDFIGAEVRMNCADNFLPYVTVCGDIVKNKFDVDVVIDMW